jgi:hypothetical protein
MSTNANMYVTVDDLMHGDYRTSQGLPQEGIVFVCKEHGVQPFRALMHPLRSSLQVIQDAGIQLDCGCCFKVAGDGAVSRRPL